MATVWTETFTPNEAAALSELSEKQVRNEIEYHVIEVPSPPRLSFPTLVYLRALKLMGLQLKVDDRVRLARRLLDAVRSSPTIDTLDIGDVLALRIGAVIKDLAERVQKFERWRDNLVTSPDIMGGEAVFPNSRLTVRRVGGMLDRGEPPDAIREDYPYLRPEDLDFARLYVRAYPRVGRPRTTSPAH
jgi:uncharacterized protein (DUF433 family)